MPFAPHCVNNRERCGPCALPPPAKQHLKCFENVSASGRGSWSPIWEMAAAAYGARAPFSQQARALPGYAPEGTSGDHSGFGTHMFYDGPPYSTGAG